MYRSVYSRRIYVRVDFGIVTVDLTERKALEIYKEEIPCKAFRFRSPGP